MVYPRFKDLREDHDLSQEAVGAVLHVSLRSYSYYERGENDIPTEALCKLADLYGTSTDYLLGRTDEIKPYPKGKGAFGHSV